jgi:predicted RNA-binding protein with PIN domain
MSYLIDGHNLIPKLGISLNELDDERQLVEILQKYARMSKQKVEVYFDRASAGHSGVKKFGMVTAHFIPVYTTADEAILKRLRGISKAASSWTVVSSDHHIQNQARALRARVISSEEFTKNLLEIWNKKGEDAGDPVMDGDDIQEWMRLFGD